MVYADFGSDSEDDDWERKKTEKEDEEIMPSPDDKEGEQFWKKVIDRMKSGDGVKDMTIYIYICL